MRCEICTMYKCTIFNLCDDSDSFLEAMIHDSMIGPG